MRPLLAAALLLMLAACGGGPEAVDPSPAQSTSAATEPTATTTAGQEHYGDLEQPPPFQVRYDDRELAIHPHTYCYGSGCVDGIAPDPPRVGSPDELRVYVPVKRFELSAYFAEVTRDLEQGSLSDGTCGGRTFEAPVEELGDGWYAVRPHGPAGLYRVGLSAAGEGDMNADLLWRTPTDGEMPEPASEMALIGETDGEPDSYGGLELSLSNLAETPEQASAEIEVTAGNGRSMTFEARPDEGRCISEGYVYFDGAANETGAAAKLGPFPFTTTVTLTLDGNQYTATAVYPDDEIKDNEPNVRLDFEPPLPGL